MNLPYPCNMQSTIESLLRSLILLEQQGEQPLARQKLLDCLDLLKYAGCDFYDLLSYYAQLSDYAESELEFLLSHAPTPQAVFLPDECHIHQCIPRWTASKYHSGSISDVIGDIQKKLWEKASGLYTYNSNLNPRNPRSLNDLYVLIITECNARWFDINRRNTYAFQLDKTGT